MIQEVLPGIDAQDTSVLDVGCGTGYQTALLREAGFSQVTGVEIKPHLAQRARQLLEDTPGVRIITGDAKKLPARKKFDAIVVGAQTNSIGDVDNLKRRLKIGGKMMIPIGLKARGLSDAEVKAIRFFQGPYSSAKLMLITRVGPNKFTQEDKGTVGFVDLV
ncbi:MAG: Methyltransferase, UbiE/COQ5 family [Candidatus Levybacteria bacterium GW2011_GWA2_40_8]|nr:MAG: Methyltransferase, UbiE/COQ5 family [Candidatus Levybacteria bacterium GW2011_GWA2_40_8]